MKGDPKVRTEIARHALKPWNVTSYNRDAVGIQAYAKNGCASFPLLSEEGGRGQRNEVRRLRRNHACAFSRQAFKESVTTVLKIKRLLMQEIGDKRVHKNKILSKRWGSSSFPEHCHACPRVGGRHGTSVSSDAPSGLYVRRRWARGDG